MSKYDVKRMYFILNNSIVMVEFNICYKINIYCFGFIYETRVPDLILKNNKNKEL